MLFNAVNVDIIPWQSEDSLALESVALRGIQFLPLLSLLHF